LGGGDCLIPKSFNRLPVRDNRYLRHSRVIESKNGKAIRVTGRGGRLSYETSRLPHFLDKRLTVGGEGDSLTGPQAALYPQEDFWYSFLLEAELIPGP
jgi:hypothetical protein